MGGWCGGGGGAAESSGERALVSMKGCYQSFRKMVTRRHTREEELVA